MENCSRNSTHTAISFCFYAKRDEKKNHHYLILKTDHGINVEIKICYITDEFGKPQDEWIVKIREASGKQKILKNLDYDFCVKIPGGTFMCLAHTVIHEGFKFKYSDRVHAKPINRTGYQSFSQHEESKLLPYVMILTFDNATFESFKKLVPIPSKKRKNDDMTDNIQNDAFFHDLILRVGDDSSSKFVDYFGDKSILSLNSPVMREIIKSGMIESTTSVIAINHFSQNCVQEFLNYCYDNEYELPEKSSSELVELLEFSKYYMVDVLNEICEEELFVKIKAIKDQRKQDRNYGEESLNEILSYAYKHNKKHIIEKALNCTYEILIKK